MDEGTCIWDHLPLPESSSDLQNCFSELLSEENTYNELQIYAHWHEIQSLHERLGQSWPALTKMCFFKSSSMLSYGVISTAQKHSCAKAFAELLLMNQILTPQA